ncbi:MAG: hypothetical protein PUD63_12235 [Clostridia bacterium]|nr:hypothetical protein [Clostridia bacterium]
MALEVEAAAETATVVLTVQMAQIVLRLAEKDLVQPQENLANHPESYTQAVAAEVRAAPQRLVRVLTAEEMGVEVMVAQVPRLLRIPEAAAVEVA